MKVLRDCGLILVGIALTVFIWSEIDLHVKVNNLARNQMGMAQALTDLFQSSHQGQRMPVAPMPLKPSTPPAQVKQ